MKLVSFLALFATIIVPAFLFNENVNFLEILNECSSKQSLDESIFEVLRPPGVALFSRKSNKQKCFLACYYIKMDIVRYNLVS